MAIVETKQIRKVFADHTAVDGVDLATREGEFLVLLGPSGCGKTTLLRMIAGLEKQTSGDIVIGNRVVNDLAPRERKIAMVFQSYALYPHMTVAKNIAFPLKAQKVDPKSIGDRVGNAVVGFRPENLLPRAAYTTSDPLVTFWYRVTRVEDLGSDRLLYGSLRDLAPDIKMIVNLPHTIHLSVTPGESYELACKAGDLKFFDPGSGLRVPARPLEGAKA